MKKLVLILLVSVLATVAQAQPCTPTWTGSGSGIQPDTATNLPQVVEETPYSTVINFKVPQDTVYLGFSATVDSIVIDNVSGLSVIPASTPFTYAAFNNGTFPGGSEGCVLITGTPADSSAGVYPIVVDVSIYATSSLVGAITLPQTVNGYRIQVNEFTGTKFAGIRENGLVAYPSIASSHTELIYFTNVSSDVAIDVVNALGQNVISESVTAQAGTNQTMLDLSVIPNGSYIVTLRTNNGLRTTRILVSK